MIIIHTYLSVTINPNLDNKVPQSTLIISIASTESSSLIRCFTCKYNFYTIIVPNKIIITTNPVEIVLKSEMEPVYSSTIMEVGQ